MSTTIARSPTRGLTITAWVLQVILAAAFLAAAGAKLAGVPMLVEEFEQIGLGQWVRYVTAGVEITGATALLVPGLAGLGALWLGTTMAVATLVHLYVLHSNPAGAIVLVGLCAVVLWLRRDQVAALRDRFL